MPSLELTALLLTWFIVIPLLVIFPPAKIIWLRKNLENQRNSRKVQTAVLSENFAANTNAKETDEDDENKQQQETSVISNNNENSNALRKRRESKKASSTPSATSTASLPSPNASHNNNNNNSVKNTIGLKNYIIPTNSQIVLVFVNPKSGGRLGEDLLHRMKEILNPNQVFDLSQKNIDVKAILSSFSSSKNKINAPTTNNNNTNTKMSNYDDNIRILVAGGDGSIGWVITSCLAIGKKFPVGILPLGTGNDLARSVGWGSGATKSDVTREALTNRIAEVLAAKAAPFDHWTVEIDENVDDILRERKRQRKYLDMKEGDEDTENDRSSFEDLDENQFDGVAPASNTSPPSNSSFTAAEEDAMMKRLNSTRRNTKSVSPIVRHIDVADVPAAAAAGDMPHQQSTESPATKKKKILSMFNYISVGIDAEIALRFHAEREEFPEDFSSQAANLVRYARLGFEKSFDSRPLNDRIEVYQISQERQQSLDKNNLIPFHPSWKCLMFSNILYYQRKNFWGDLTYDAEGGDADVADDDLNKNKEQEQTKSNSNNNNNNASSFTSPLDEADAREFKSASVQDGILEAMAMAGTLHFGIVHCNLDHALRVSQQEGFELLLTEPGQAIQLDGEPWVQTNPCKIRISRAGQYPMLRGTGGSEWWNKIIG